MKFESVVDTKMNISDSSLLAELQTKRNLTKLINDDLIADMMHHVQNYNGVFSKLTLAQN